MTGKFQRIKRVGLHKVKYAARVNCSTDESDIASSGKEPLTNIVKKYWKQRETSSNEDDIPLMELAKRIWEKGRADKLANVDTSAEDQKSVNEVSSFNEYTKESQVKTLLQTIVGISIKFKDFKI